MYSQYLAAPGAISFEDAYRVYAELTDAVREAADEIAKELFDDFIAACKKYSVIRAEWLSLSWAERSEKDSGRTIAHDRVIDTHNILFRYLRGKELSSEWYTILAYDKEDKASRKRVGDFACYVSLFLGLEAR